MGREDGCGQIGDPSDSVAGRGESLIILEMKIVPILEEEVITGMIWRAPES